MPGKRIQQRMDTNGDGVISKEVATARERLFRNLDRNGNGVIERNEIERARHAIKDRAETAQARLGNRGMLCDNRGRAFQALGDLRTAR
ncbi:MULTISPECIES: EF-hand domain-containing protein [unclassified Mesorhizobium]|uniref:EF-hand domain-containing protein n=1 Tax=unclassified Mesorhizobium TaxID=325217 RepID=UPI00112C12EE|nr:MULTISPECIES: EF-hand domain-containing protein [unclassified Mesorhizobium]MBZ9962150.1 hypothetical protein [Mesorhizobium sp. BR1-1-14]TPL41258.1 EF-hand domain-containing protein [Mesorhizobium sp. B2-4-4]